MGTAADLVLLDWQQVSYPYLDELTPVLDAVIQRAKTGGVRHVMCAGETIYADGRGVSKTWGNLLVSPGLISLADA